MNNAGKEYIEFKDMIPCRCGTKKPPAIEQDLYILRNENRVAWVAKCPECWNCTDCYETQEEAYNAWNSQKLSDVTEMLSKDLNPRELNREEVLNVIAAALKELAREYKTYCEIYMVGGYDKENQLIRKGTKGKLASLESVYRRTWLLESVDSDVEGIMRTLRIEASKNVIRRGRRLDFEAQRFIREGMKQNY